MTDDPIAAIRARWAGVALSYTEDAGDVYLATTTWAVRVEQPNDDDRALLQLASAAPADIRDLLAALHREQELTGELTAQHGPLASLVAVATRWRAALATVDQDAGREYAAACDALLRAVEEAERTMR